MILLISFMIFLNSASFSREPVCIKLENISIGCFPGPDHPCLRVVATNAELRDATNDFLCHFYKGLDVHLENMDQGPIAFECKTWKATSQCANPEFGGSCSADDCEEPVRPSCSQKCTTCVQEKLIKSIPVNPKGCEIRCRPRCADEPYWSGEVYTGCPAADVDACHETVPDCRTVELPDGAPDEPFDGKLNACSSIDPCPKFVELTSGGWRETVQGDPDAVAVNIGGAIDVANCDIREPGSAPNPHLGLSCPWLDEFGPIRNNCEPIPECCRFPKIDNYDAVCPNGCVVN